MEKRNNTRVIFNVNAVIEYDNMSINGTVANLSLNGILVNTSEKVPENTNVSVKILMEGTSSQLNLDLKGIVLRSEKKETAIELKSIDLDSFIHLRNIIIYNEGDDKKIMEEFYKIKKR
jgi:hypothetical protein